MTFKALLFVQDNCDPCHRSLNALLAAYEKSDFIEVTQFKDQQGNKTKEATHYNIEATPTLVLVRPSGAELSRVKGSTKMPPALFSRVALFLNEVNEKERAIAS